MQEKKNIKSTKKIEREREREKRKNILMWRFYFKVGNKNT